MGGFGCSGKGANIGHDRAFSQLMPARDMTCSVAVAFGQGSGQTDRERRTRYSAAGVPVTRQKVRNESVHNGMRRVALWRVLLDLP